MSFKLDCIVYLCSGLKRFELCAIEGVFGFMLLRTWENLRTMPS